MNYIIWANIYLVFFYGFYWLFMRNETFFQLSRWYLLGSSLLAFILPVLDLKKYFWEPKVELFSVALNFEGQVNALGGSGEQSSASWFEALRALPVFVWIYLLGCLFFFSKLLYQGVLIRKGLKSVNAGQAYSFFHIIHVDPEVKNYAKVLAHEKVHVEQFHSVDILLMELLKIFNWFNPVVYLLCRSTKLNHEYIADARTAEYGLNRIQYAESLLSQAFESTNFSLKNNFINESFIKNRIAMLFKNKSKKSVLSRFLILIPIMLVVIAFQSKEPEIMEVTAADLAELSPRGTSSSEKSPLLAKQKEERAVPKEGWPAFLEGIANSYQFPKEAVSAKTKGRLVAAFVVETDGSLIDIKVINDLGHGTAEEAIRVLKNMPNWIPANIGGKAVRSSFTLPLLLDYETNAEVEVKAGGDVPPPPPVMGPVGGKAVEAAGDVFLAVEEEPVPPGGIDGFLRYVGDNYVFPKDAEVSGRVVVLFVVELDGTLSNVRSVRDLGHGTGEEAIRVVKNSGKWKPGIQGGQMVRVEYTLPIVLNMENGEKAASIF